MWAVVADQDNTAEVFADCVHNSRLLFFFTEDVHRGLMHCYVGLFFLGTVSPAASGGLSEIFLAVVFLPRLFGSFFVHFTRRFHCASPSLVLFGRFCHVYLSHKVSWITMPVHFSNFPTNQRERMQLGPRVGGWRAAAYRDRRVEFPAYPSVHSTVPALPPVRRRDAAPGYPTVRPSIMREREEPRMVTNAHNFCSFEQPVGLSRRVLSGDDRSGLHLRG